MTRLRHCIDPTVDWVFKVLFGSEANKDILLSFLNSILKPAQPIIDVQLLNPYNEREFKKDKLTIVDIKAKGTDGSIYQIEMQLSVFAALPARMLYNISDLYRGQLKEGQDFNELRPVISIWILTNTLFPDSPWFHHRFQFQDARIDPQTNVLQRVALPHQIIHTLELPKWSHPQHPLDDESAWLYFLKEAKNWHELPPDLNLPIMQRVMKTMEQFSEKQRAYHKYQDRVNYLRQQSSIEKDRIKAEQERAQAEQAKIQAEKDKAQAEKDKVQAEKDKVQAQELLMKERDEKEQAILEKEKAQAEREQERSQKEQERQRNDYLRKKLLALGVDPDTH